MGIFSNKRPRARQINHLSELEEMMHGERPVLIDFFQVGCGPCQVMDGIVNELAREYGDSAHIVKVDVTKVAGAAQMFKVRSTPTFVLIGRAPVKRNKKQRRAGDAGETREPRVGQRWRTQGMVKKDQLQRVLEGNGAERIG